MPSVPPRGVTLEFGRAIPRRCLIPGSDCRRSSGEPERLIPSCAPPSLPPPPAVLPAGGGGCPHILAFLALLDAPPELTSGCSCRRAELSARSYLVPSLRRVLPFLPGFPAVQAERICPRLPASLARHFKPRILQDSSRGAVGRSCWEEQAVPEAPGLHHVGNLADLFLLETLNAQRLEYPTALPRQKRGSLPCQVVMGLSGMD